MFDSNENAPNSSATFSLDHLVMKKSLFRLRHLFHLSSAESKSTEDVSLLSTGKACQQTCAVPTQDSTIWRPNLIHALVFLLVLFLFAVIFLFKSSICLFVQIIASSHHGRFFGQMAAETANGNVSLNEILHSVLRDSGASPRFLLSSDFTWKGEQQKSKDRPR